MSQHGLAAGQSPWGRRGTRAGVREAKFQGQVGRGGHVVYSLIRSSNISEKLKHPDVLFFLLKKDTAKDRTSIRARLCILSWAYEGRWADPRIHLERFCIRGGCSSKLKSHTKSLCGDELNGDCTLMAPHLPFSALQRPEVSKLSAQGDTKELVACVVTLFSDHGFSSR